MRTLSAAYSVSRISLSSSSSWYRAVPSLVRASSSSMMLTREFFVASASSFSSSSLFRTLSSCSIADCFSISLASICASCLALAISSSSRSSASSLDSCSDLNPAICASTATISFFASMSSFWNSMLSLSRLAFCCAWARRMFARIAFSCSSSILPRFSFAATRSAMVFRSSSRICLCCSACRSYFSIRPWFITSASSACLLSSVIAVAAPNVFLV